MKSRVLMVMAVLLLGAAGAQAQAINEGFDNITNLPGWFMQNNSQPIGVTNWFQGNSTVFPAQTGGPTAYIGTNYNNGAGLATISNWLLTPPITLANGATFTFWTRSINGDFPDRMQIRMSLAGSGTDVGTTATSVGTFTELLLDINPTYTSTGYPIVWTEFTINLTGIATPTLGRLAFRYFVENGGPNGANSNYIGVDTVTFTPVLVQPTRLTVDPTGNFVIEPNEAGAVVAPFWRNTGTATITSLTGTASNFTGPAGAVYTITDASANYGSLAAGAEGSCTSTGNCYGVTVTAATRPVAHWDTTILETVSEGPTTKTWTLHIGGSFTDVVTTSPFYRFIETLFHHGVTGGCTADAYCPTSTTTRDQMAAFVLVAKEGAGYAPPACVAPNLFSDVPETSPFCRFIEELANRSVVTGCGPNLYCPASPVTREQMAIFVLRTLDPTLDPPACTTPMFADVPASSPFCRWIEELARRGVVTGCGGGNYCPTSPVTREQMGVFLSATFSLALYGV